MANVKKVKEDVVATEATTNDTVEVKETTKTTSTAKAGKRSAKAIKETEEKLAKEERKKSDASSEAAETAKPIKKSTPTRSKLERRGKKYREAAAKLDNTKTYSLEEGLELAIKTSPAKFDATVELHLRLSLDPRHADQNIRDAIVLPAGTGKTVRVAVLTENVTEAQKAGADFSGVEEILNQLEKGQINFDILITSPEHMAKLGKHARLLGPRGLMPNPKSGTVTTDIPKAIAESKAGRVEYRVDSTGIVHVGIGKVSFSADKLVQNAQAVIASIRSNKPSSVKSNYIKSSFITTTMGPSIKITLV